MNPAVDGPLLIKGNVTLVSSSGRESWQGGQAALCRCGASKSKPYCDNSHGEAGFRDPGALGPSQMPATGDSEEPGVQLTLAPNGPVIVNGTLTIVAANGSSTSGAKCALCRCGASKNKPFCDGEHKAGGVEAD